MRRVAVAFFSGVLIDVLAVSWTRSVAAHEAGAAVALSVLLSLANVRGLGAAISGWKAEAAFLVGCGLGTAATMHWMPT